MCIYIYIYIYLSSSIYTVCVCKVLYMATEHFTAHSYLYVNILTSHHENYLYGFDSKCNKYISQPLYHYATHKILNKRYAQNLVAQKFEVDERINQIKHYYI